MRCAVTVLLTLLLLAAPARAQVFGPPEGKVFTGLTGSNSVDKFAGEVGKRPAVFGFFTYWNQGNEYTFRYAEKAGARLMLHISTAQNYGVKEEISPRGIARGQGDEYLLALNARIAEEGEPVYVRLMAEMNQTNNAYCAFNKDGSSRGASHSTSAFKAAWRRSALILRGGPLDAINAKLRKLRLPEVRSAEESLPEPQVSLLWVPQTEGTPNIPANLPSAYWPGEEYVDWVGTDFYSRFPAFAKLERFYAAYPGKPFVFGEWAMWGADNPGFVKQLFSWVNTHKRVKMMLYNQGANPNGPFRLNSHPKARAELRKALRNPRFLATVGGG
ncbi:hypothetical protein DVA67_024050 [Solirubrobacter sp. CPCC 204708]|uniref:GH26 domain-containing protein n=1 Tax=Solirubrobacter deserti TaxID=2282478 RepID=A0ABT4RKR9_9ACTN|nr:hypothetical protein [Solirubrobacter deserti]MBE2319069.1 hypothetical protein [Solirubrobacter deserti]MDA0139148.1 hypothetical protein [Solirubrobacter deserti]